MKVQRIYIDTSVIGGCRDDEFAPWSNGLMKDFRLGNFKPVLSRTVALEIIRAPEEVRRIYAELLNLNHELLEITPEATALGHCRKITIQERELHKIGSLTKDNKLMLRFKFSDAKVTCSDRDFSHYLNNWDKWPVIQH